jgi:hypothetical protein
MYNQIASKTETFDKKGTSEVFVTEFILRVLKIFQKFQSLS